MITAKKAKAKTAEARERIRKQEFLYIKKSITEAVSEGEETVCLGKSISDGAVKKLSELGYKLSFGTIRYSSGELRHICYVSWSD